VPKEIGPKERALRELRAARLDQAKTPVVKKAVGKKKAKGA
jgi:hypothetical protein